MQHPYHGLLLGALVSCAQAGDEPFDAQKFHAQNCTRCHDPQIYVRENRRVNTRLALDNQVRMCDAQLRTRLFDDQLDALSDHLDRNYYHFTP